MADFAYTGLKELFSVENFTAAATDDTGSGDSSSGTGASGSSSDSSTGASGSGSDSDSSSSGSSAGAIAGGVVGGVAGVALIGAAAFFILRRRKAKRAALQQNIEGAGAGEKTYYGTGGYNNFNSGQPHAEMPGQTPARSEVSGSTPHAELPDSNRFELAS